MEVQNAGNTIVALLEGCASDGIGNEAFLSSRKARFSPRFMGSGVKDLSISDYARKRQKNSQESVPESFCHLVMDAAQRYRNSGGILRATPLSIAAWMTALRTDGTTRSLKMLGMI